MELTSILKYSIKKTSSSIRDSVRFLKEQDDLSLLGLGLIGEIAVSPIVTAGYIVAESYRTLVGKSQR